MSRAADLAFVIVGGFACIGLTSTAAWQRGYDTAKAECKPAPRTEIPFKQMTKAQQVRWIMWFNRDREVVK